MIPGSTRRHAWNRSRKTGGGESVDALRALGPGMRGACGSVVPRSQGRSPSPCVSPAAGRRRSAPEAPPADPPSFAARGSPVSVSNRRRPSSDPPSPTRPLGEDPDLALGRGQRLLAVAVQGDAALVRAHRVLEAEVAPFHLLHQGLELGKRRFEASRCRLAIGGFGHGDPAGNECGEGRRRRSRDQRSAPDPVFCRFRFPTMRDNRCQMNGKRLVFSSIVSHCGASGRCRRSPSRRTIQGARIGSVSP